MLYPKDKDGRIRWLNEFLNTRPRELPSLKTEAAANEKLEELLRKERQLINQTKALLCEYPDTREDKKRQKQLIMAKIAAIYLCWTGMWIVTQGRLPRRE